MSVSLIHNGNGGLPAFASASEKAIPSQTRKESFQIPVHTSEEIMRAKLRGQSISVGEEQLIKAIEAANKSLVGTYTSLEFSIHEETKQIMVKVLDRDTGEMIREIPPEKMLDIVAKIWELAGILVDERR